MFNSDHLYFILWYALPNLENSIDTAQMAQSHNTFLHENSHIAYQTSAEWTGISLILLQNYQI